MKMIFLDIDGVLQPYDNTERFKHDLKETVEEVSKKFDDKIYFTMDPYDVAAVYYDWDDKAVRLLDDYDMSSSFGSHMVRTYDRLTEKDKVKTMEALSL